MKPGADKSYLALVHTLRCAACRLRPCEEAHHPRGLEFGTGTGLKAPDRMAIPLCASCHREYHTLGRQTWEAKYRPQAEMIAETQRLLDQ